MKNRGCVNLAIAGILLFLCCGGYFVLNEGYFPKLIDDPMISFSDVQPTSIAGRGTKTAQTDESIIVMFDSNEPLQEQESYAFLIQEGSPLAMMSWIYGCNWMGIAGQVFYDGLPVEDIIVEVGGSLDGEDVMGLGITGLAADYGSGGFEIQLSDHPIGSVDSIWIQLKDNLGLELSRKYYITSYDQCEKNLILINFNNQEVAPYTPFYFPLFFR
jgi:hypothetical protein